MADAQVADGAAVDAPQDQAQDQARDPARDPAQGAQLSAPTAAAPRTPAPPRARNVSILPAMAVLIVAVGTLGLFGLLNVVTSGTTTATTLPFIIGTLPKGNGLFAHAVQDGVPPPNIASAFIDPAGTRRIGVVTTGGGGTGDYDLEYVLRVKAPRARLLGFYREDLEALGWNLFSVSGGTSAHLLFQKAGTDGNYWDAGVVATATSPIVTTYTFKLFQFDDFS